MSNVFGTSPEGIEVSVQRMLSTGTPRYGGAMVDQANTLSGRVYRARDGWDIEVVGGLLNPKAVVHISKHGTSAHVLAEIELFTHLGREMPTGDELEAARLADENKRAAEAAAAILEWIVEAEEDVTLVYDKCTHCRTELSVTTGVTFKYPDGSLACSRCAMVEIAKSA